MSIRSLGFSVAFTLPMFAQIGFAQDHGAARRRAVDPYESEARAHSGASELLAKTPSPFGNLIDQNDFETTGAKLLRVTEFSSGVSYGSASVTSKSKWDGGKDKISATVTPMELFAVYPIPLGIRLGLQYAQSDSKSKATYELFGDRSNKYSSSVIAFTAAAATPSGFGGALIVSTHTEARTADGTVYFKKTDDDANYGVILPQFYYAAEDFEAILIWKPSQRHETGTNVGVYELKLEYGLSDIHPIVDVVRYRNSENDGDTESDHFKLEGGIRYILDRESNIRVLALLEEAYYTDRTNASFSNGASWGLNVAGEHVVQVNHVLGYSVFYQQWNAKGKLDNYVTSQPSTTISTDRSGLSLSYKYVLR